MSNEINIAQNIINLRKKHKVTQEQLADAVNVSPQAVSKWENAACLPDSMALPLIADFFHVSIDYLFYGCERTCDDIYERISERVAEMHAKDEKPYEEAVKLSSAAQHGILSGLFHYFNTKEPFQPTVYPHHLLGFHGLSICSPKGFSAIVTDDFVNSVDGKTMRRAKMLFKALANDDCFRVTVEILNFQGITTVELKEKTGFDEERLNYGIKLGKEAGFILERESSHTMLGSEFCIQRHHYNCLCLIISTVKMIEISLQGATRSMYFEKFFMSFDEEEMES